MLRRCSLEIDVPRHSDFFPTRQCLRAAVRGRVARRDRRLLHVVTTWWHQKRLSEQELINSSRSPWLGNFRAAFRLAVVRRVAVKHRVRFYSLRVNVRGLQPRSRS